MMCVELLEVLKHDKNEASFFPKIVYCAFRLASNYLQYRSTNLKLDKARCLW